MLEWGDIESNPRGNILTSWIIGNNLVVHNDMFNCVPTFYGPNGNSVIDLVFSSQEISRFVNCKVLSTHILSDHKCLLLTYSEHPDGNENISQNSLCGWYINKKKLDVFCKKSKELVSVCLESPGGLTPTKCTDIITTICDDIFIRKDSVPKKNAKYWWNDDIKKMRKDVFKLNRKIAFLMNSIDLPRF